MQYKHLSQEANIFSKATGLKVAEFDALVKTIAPRFAQAEQQRLRRPHRQREVGGGPDYKLDVRDQLLLVVVWLRLYPTGDVLGYLFGVSASSVSRTLVRLLPLLEEAGCDSMRLPDPGRKRRRQLSVLLEMIPELTVIIDTFEQAVQRPQDREQAKAHYSGKQKQHTLKTQVAVDFDTGYVVDVASSVCGPVADIKLLEDSGLLQRLPAHVGKAGDLAYIKLSSHYTNGFAPRRKPRGQPRPVADIIFNRLFAHFRIPVEHSINRLRRFQSITQTDRHHRRYHTARTRAIAGLVNRHLCACGLC